VVEDLFRAMKAFPHSALRSTFSYRKNAVREGIFKRRLLRKR
jgi:hypothetical protein